MSAQNCRPLVLAHRGARLEAPENTLPAFQRAREAGADGVELDVRPTQDGQLVLLHDAVLDRTTDGHGPAHRATLVELRSLDAGSWFDPAFALTRLCTLEEGLAALDWASLVNVERKGPAGHERALLRTIAQAGMQGRVVLSAFSPLALWRLRRLDRRVRLAWLHGPSVAGRLALPLARILHLQGVHPHRLALSERYVQRAHQQGLTVVPWTVNDPDDARQMAGWGVDALITDRPQEVRRSQHDAGTVPRS